MGNITKTLTLQDKFSGPLNSYINKLKQSVENSSKAGKGIDKMGDEAKEAGTKLSKMGNEAKKATDSANNIGSKVGESFKNSAGGVAKFAAAITAAIALVKSFQSAAERAPKEVIGPFSELKGVISDIVASPIVAFMKSIGGSVKNLTNTLNSEAGKKFTRGLNTIAEGLGKIVSILIDKIAAGIEWVGNNFDKVAAYASALIPILMVIAAVIVAMNWPIVAIIMLVVTAVNKLNEMGVTAGEIFNAVGQAAGWLYSLGYNIIADIWNVIAIFAEFFANVFNDPVKAIGNLFVDVFTWILDTISTVASAIGALFGQDWGGGINRFRDNIKAWADKNIGENEIKFSRMEKLDGTQTLETMNKWGNKFEDFGNSLSDLSLSQAKDIDLISKDTGSIAKTVTKDDVKALIDMATQKFVSNVNLISQTPTITITGANTGNTAADRRAIADAVKMVLVEEAAAGGSVAAGVYSGG